METAIKRRENVSSLIQKSAANITSLVDLKATQKAALIIVDFFIPMVAGARSKTKLALLRNADFIT